MATRKALATLGLSAAAVFAGWTCDANSSSPQVSPRSDLTLTGAVVAHLFTPASKCTTSNAPTGKILNAFIEQPPYEVAIGIAGYHGSGHYQLSPQPGAFVVVSDGTGGQVRQWADGAGTVTVEHANVGLSGTVDARLSGVSTPAPGGVVEVRGSWGCEKVREVGS